MKERWIIIKYVMFRVEEDGKITLLAGDHIPLHMKVDNYRRIQRLRNRRCIQQEP